MAVNKTDDWNDSKDAEEPSGSVTIASGDCRALYIGGVLCHECTDESCQEERHLFIFGRMWHVPEDSPRYAD